MIKVVMVPSHWR